MLRSASTVLGLLLVAYAPGVVIFRLPIANRDRRAALDAEERAFWAILISLAISLSVTLGLAAAGRYSFDRLLWANAAFTVILAVAGRLRLGFGGRAAGPRLTAIIPLALVGFGVWQFFPPAEYIVGGKDPGVYINEGVQIAQRGTLVYKDPVVASVPPFARDLFFPSHQREDYYGVRFMGFFVQDPDSGAVVGQFPHLLPASIAIGYGLDGLTGARRAVGVWALIGVLAVYFAAARLIGHTAAGAGATLLSLHVVQVWFARYPNAEVVMQALLFAGLLAAARAHVDRDGFFGPVAGWLLGLLLFLRFDAVIALAGVGLGLVLLALRGTRPRLSFLLTLAAIAAAAAMYLLGPLRAYAYLPIVFLSNFATWQYALIAGAIVIAMVAVAAAGRMPRVSARVAAVAPALFAVVVVGAAMYALFLRHPAGKLTDYDAYALRTFTGYYLTLPALLAALAGYAIVARRAFWNDPAFFATLTAFSLFFFYKIRIWPDHFWMARRFLPVILPGALVLAAATAFAGAGRGSRNARAARSVLGAIFLTLLALSYMRATRPILPHVEYAGVIPQLERLAGAIGDNDLLIVESRDAGTDTHILALPLAYIYDRHVLVLSSRLPDKAAFAAFLDWAHTRYPRVMYMGGGGTDLLSRRWGVTAVATGRFQVPEYDAPRNAYPRFVRQKEFEYTLYAFTPPQPGDDAETFDLDVGVRDDLHVLRFHAKETTEGRTYRWSRDTSYVAVTAIGRDSRQVTLWLNDGGRPPQAPPAEVSIYLANELLGTVRVTRGFHPYALPIPAALAARVASVGEPVQLKLVSSVWLPRRFLGTPDDRDLGVMVDRVQVR